MKKLRKNKVLITILLVSLFIFLAILYYIIANYGTTPLLIPPSVKMNMLLGEKGYEIEIINISPNPYGDKWFKLERVTYLLSPRPLPTYGEKYFPLGSKGGTTEEYFRALIKDKDNPYNMASGKLTEIFNVPRKDVIYYDKNDDKIISNNDTIVISYSLIPKNLTNESYLLNLFYSGDLEGSLSKEIFEFIGYIRIENIP
jgi:hypothetical protein